MRDLYMHIGHGKTGSSYIQSSLSISRDKLIDNGYSYPVSQGYENARKGYISSGNGMMILEDGFSIDGGNTVLSGESLFGVLASKKRQVDFSKRIEEINPGSINILLFLRDPVEHCCSRYQQLIKRGGRTESIEETFDSYDIPEKVNVVLDYIDGLGANVEVVNYSVNKGSLLKCVESWLSLPSDTLELPPHPVVNRSLTKSELMLQRELNAQVGDKCGNIIADQLCNQLPSIKSSDIRPPLDIQSRLWDRLESDIDKVNSRIPSDAVYKRERDVKPSADPDSDDFSFNKDQLRIIAESLAKLNERVKVLRAKIK